MPYIHGLKRERLDPLITQLRRELVDLEMDDENNNLEGNLNYVITKLLRMCYGTSYGEINDAMGMLTCVALEHYRTIAAPYENIKKEENGDVMSVVSAPEIVAEIVVEQSNELNDRMESDDDNSICE